MPSIFCALMSLLVFNLNYAGEILFADALSFPQQRTVTYSVTQDWAASGTLDNNNRLERCTSTLDFDLSIKEELAIGSFKFGYELEVTLKRFSFAVESNDGISSQYHSDKKDNMPAKLQTILARNIILNRPLKFKVLLNYVFISTELHDKVLGNIFDQVYDSNSSIQNIYEATNNLWFLKTTNLESIISLLITKPSDFIKKSDYYEVHINPRMYLDIFGKQSSKMKQPSSLTTKWVNRQNSNSLHFLLCIDQITSNSVEGSWQGDALFKLRDSKGKILEEKSSLSGTVAWDKKNALIQQRTLKWEGNVESKLSSSQTTIHFTLDEVIQSKESPTGL